MASEQEGIGDHRCQWPGCEATETEDHSAYCRDHQVDIRDEPFEEPEILKWALVLLAAGILYAILLL